MRKYFNSSITSNSKPTTPPEADSSCFFGGLDIIGLEHFAE